MCLATILEGLPYWLILWQGAFITSNLCFANDKGLSGFENCPCGSHAITGHGPQEVDLERYGQYFLSLWDDRQRCIATTYIGNAGHNAAMKKSLLLGKFWPTTTGDGYPPRLYNF